MKLRVCAGLGNRLKPIASAFGLGLPLQLDWAMLDHNTYYNCEEGAWLSPWYGGFEYFFENEIPRFVLDASGVRHTNVIDNPDAPYVTWRFLHGSGEHDYDFMYEATPPDLEEVLIHGFSQLQPHREVVKAVNDVHQSWRLGMQIRRRYHATRSLSLEPFHRAIESEKGRKVLVVTDDEDTLTTLLKAYPKQVCYFEKSFNHVETLKSRSCLIEMLLLANCEQLVLTRESSFSECAFWFNKVMICKKDCFQHCKTASSCRSSPVLW